MWQRALCRLQVVAILERCLVAMVTVGHEHLPGGHRHLYCLQDVRVGNHPEAILRLPLRDGGGMGLTLTGPSQKRGQVSIGVSVQGHDGTEVGPAGLHQRQSVGLGAGPGELVGHDDALLELLQTYDGHESLAPPDVFLVGELFLDQVHGGHGFGGQYPLVEPLLKEVRGP